MTISVLLVDDEELVRTGLSAILGNSPGITVVGEASDGSEVVTKVLELRPDVVIMDVRMPRVDGIAATRELMARVPRPPRVLVITTFERDDYVYEALREGASGFLLKRSRPAEIVQAVRTVATGDSVLFPSAIRGLVSGRRRRDAGGGPARVRFTEREAEVLRLMGRGMSNAEIAAELFLGVQTVKTHVSSTLAKLGARDRTQAVVFAYEAGFIELR
ncbi:DNA-binding response regulator [Streptomyces nitrosporeus]|uniref:DNA-binding response regulator n=1 Tax=Streptomyces nitrosporeus TaxID=28894 RepID=A0A5J6F759_9ACTN|nr:response regulator transcription factor [Streptomyces nitrosporeus]QEU71773.1 DNA-binding response regulator [Streptomyces nitrosporeus]GGY94373.1 DNA-binding response regulator [Streptomyces nitrosporeus]